MRQVRIPAGIYNWTGTQGVGCFRLLLIIGLFCAPVISEADSISIRDLQISTASDEWQSSYVGQQVSISGGIVTHIAGFRITIQDPALGDAWAATEIRAYENEAPLRDLSPGDQVNFYNVLVEEFRGGTIPQFINDSTYEIISSGNPLPEPLVVDVTELAFPPDRESCEKYESMLIAIEDVRIGRLDLGKSEDNYELLCGSTTLWASDYINLDLAVPPFPTFYVQAGERYARIQGIYQEYCNLDQGWDYFQLLPRGEADYIRSNLYTIRDVQESSAVDNWQSPLLGLRLDLQGTVSAVSDGDCSLAICDQLLGSQWSGLQIDDSAAGLTGLSIGDEILFTDVLVTEEDNHSLLVYDDESLFELLSSENSLIPIPVDPERIAVTAGPESAEPYEGMLVVIYNAEVTGCGVSEGEGLYYLSVDGQRILCSDVCSSLKPADSDFFVRVGDNLGWIKGILVEQTVTGGSAYVLHPHGNLDYHFTVEDKIYSSWGKIKFIYK